MNFKQYFLEKWVLGLIEFMELDGLGTIPAKLDTGNSGHNVLHGTNIQIQGKHVIFRTVNERNIQKPLADTIDINVGSNNIEKRPVVNFNVKLGDQIFEDIPFSIADRTTNLYKILVCKDFIEDHLQAVVDPSQEDVASLNVNVEIES